MSLNSVASNEQLKKYYNDYVVPPLAAGAAFVPVMHGFMVKSAKQLQVAPPIFSINSVVEGVKASPNVGAVIGTQLVVQNALKKVFKEETALNMVATSAVVGVISTPFLAALNGRTRGLTFVESLRRLTPFQTGAIVSRETLFLLSMLNPLNAYLKREFGDTQTVESASAALSGASGSLAGHAADTALTRLQNNVQILPTRLLKGAVTKSVATGAFALLYQLLSKHLSQ